MWNRNGSYFGLIVRFRIKDQCLQAFDMLAAKTIELINDKEPETLAYLCHTVESTPNIRIFYEIYKNREAFEAHERQPHVRYFLTEREHYLEGYDVDFISSTHGVGGCLRPNEG